MRAHLYTVVYRYIRPLPSRPPPPAYRGATEGPGSPSYVGSSKERPCPDLGPCAPPPAPAGAAVGGWVPPPSRWLHLPSEAQAQKPPPPPPPPRGPAYGLPRPCAARGAADGLPHVLPCPPLSHCCAPVPALPALRGRGGGCAAPGGTGDPGPVPDTPDLEQQPLAAPEPEVQPALQHPAAPDPAVQHPAPVLGGVERHLDPAQLEAVLQLSAAHKEGEGGLTLCPFCLRRCSERGRDGAKNVHQACAPPSLPPAPRCGTCPWEGGGGCNTMTGCTASGGGACSHRPPGDMRPEPLRLSAHGWD